jgi:hypothetical protein
MIDFDDADDPPEVRIDRLRAYIETCKHSTAFHAEKSAEKGREIASLRETLGVLLADFLETAESADIDGIDDRDSVRRARASLAKSQGHPPHGPGVTGV